MNWEELEGLHEATGKLLKGPALAFFRQCTIFEETKVRILRPKQCGEPKYAWVIAYQDKFDSLAEACMDTVYAALSKALGAKAGQSCFIHGNYSWLAQLNEDRKKNGIPEIVYP